MVFGMTQPGLGPTSCKADALPLGINATFEKGILMYFSQAPDVLSHHTSVPRHSIAFLQNSLLQEQILERGIC